MPTFSAAPSQGLAAAVKRLVGSYDGPTPVQFATADSMAANTARNLGLAEKARQDVEDARAAAAARTDPKIATEYATRVTGLTDPQGTRLAQFLSGATEPAPQPMQEQAAGLGVGALPDQAVTMPEGVSPAQRQAFSTALGALIANRLATGKTNAQQLTAGESNLQNQSLQRDAVAAPDLPTQNRIVAAMSGKLDQPFKLGNDGQVLDQATGGVNEGTRLARAAIGLSGAKTATEAARQDELKAKAGTGNTGKAPTGYRWGPVDENGQPTLVPIAGGPASPYASGPSSSLTGDAYLKTMPTQKAEQVKALAEGRLQFPGSFALRSPYWQDMLSAVSQYDPKFDAVNYNSRANTRKAFTSGKEAQNLNALNTVMGHLDDLRSAGDALNNSDWPWVNKVSNALGGQMDPNLKGRLNAFNISRQAVASEMERAYKGTGGNLADIEAWKHTLDTSDSPEAIHAAVKQGVKLLSSKIQALGDQYSKGMGITKEGLELLNPKTREVYLRLLGESSGRMAEGNIAGAISKPGVTAAASVPTRGVPPVVNALGWKLMTDAKGNKAYVSPDGKQIEEVR